MEAPPLRRRRGFSTAAKREGGRKERGADRDRRTREMSRGGGFLKVSLFFMVILMFTGLRGFLIWESLMSIEWFLVKLHPFCQIKLRCCGVFGERGR
ncbi:hypothetical protein HanIR_Chr16g0793531 [Helianthus annuus]|nr:hypothetical protein HanIR_Chr16g0793531 [Helianthus annuus]